LDLPGQSPDELMHKMTDDCSTCSRIGRLQEDCESSIQKLKQLTHVARAASDTTLLEYLLDTVKLMEAESADLKRAMEAHRRNDHGTTADAAAK
jgi:hypothetical protein